MRVRMLVSMASTAASWEVGTVADFDQEHAERLIAAGFAELVKDTTKSRKAEPETATKR